MAKHVIVDGFNVIRRDAELGSIERANFQGAQLVLIEKLAKYRRYTSNQITVVYDGGKSQNPYRQKSQKEGIQIIYSAQGETADEVIIELISKDTAHASGYLVVTADRDLATACRSQRVDVAPPEELIRRSRPERAAAKPADFWFGKKEEQAWSGHTKKKGNPRRAPKNQRRSQGLW